MTSAQASPEQDPFILDSEQIQSLAAPGVVAAGLRHFRDTRVTALDRDNEHLWATVEDEESLRDEMRYLIMALRMENEI